MSFQYQGGNMMKGAQIQESRRQDIFNNMLKQMGMVQKQKRWDDELELKKREMASDPDRLANAGFMTLANGGKPTPEQMAAMKVVDAQSMSKVKVDQYGNQIRNDSIFDLIAPQAGMNVPDQNGGAPSGFNTAQVEGVENLNAPVIRNKAEEMAYANQLQKERDEEQAKIAKKKKLEEDVPLVQGMREAITEFQKTLDEMPVENKIGPFTISDPQNGPIMGRIADIWNVPEYENLEGAQNTVALQARNLLKLPASGFSDADRQFLEQIAGGKYQSRDGYQKAINRINRMLQAEEKRLGIDVGDVQSSLKKPQKNKKPTRTLQDLSLEELEAMVRR